MTEQYAARLPAFTHNHKLFVPCDWCKVVHWFDKTELSNNVLPCHCSLQVIKKQVVHSPYESGFEIEIKGEYTETILKKYLSLWRRKHPHPNEDVFF